MPLTRGSRTAVPSQCAAAVRVCWITHWLDLHDQAESNGTTPVRCSTQMEPAQPAAGPSQQQDQGADPAKPRP
jgi:hypothetical protein